MQKAIFTYWHQGFDNAPSIIKACVRSSARHHPDWRIHYLDAENVSSWIDPVPIPDDRWQKLSLAHRSDLIRTQLLFKHGGVWADPTVWFTRSLDDWLPENMTAGLFLFRRPGRDRAISNWFIAAEPENRLLIRLYEKLCAYWSNNDFENFDRPMRASAQLFHRILARHLDLPRLWLTKPAIRLFRSFPYMIYHYAFYDLVRTDPQCEATWVNMPEVLADGPMKLQRRGLTTEFDCRAVALLTGPEREPLYKLTWKGLPSKPDRNSILGQILGFGNKAPKKQVEF